MFDNVSKTCQIIIVRSVTNAGLLLYVPHNMINNVIESYGKYNNHILTLKTLIEHYKV